MEDDAFYRLCLDLGVHSSLQRVDGDRWNARMVVTTQSRSGPGGAIYGPTCRSGLARPAAPGGNGSHELLMMLAVWFWSTKFTALSMPVSQSCAPR